MGLDQFARARRGEPTKVEERNTYTDAEGNIKEEVETYEYFEDSMELAYWRKHSSLQGFMEDLYYEKEGEGQFNNKEVVLTVDDLESLREAVSDGSCMSGGDSSEYYKDQDLQFINDALSKIEEGYEIVYESGW